MGTRFVITLPLYKQNNLTPVEVTVVRTVTNVRSATQTYGLVTGNTSIVTINAQMDRMIGGFHYYLTDVRQMMMEEVLSPVMEIRAGVKESTNTSGNRLYFFGTEPQALALNDRRLYLVKPGADPMLATVTDVQLLAPAVANRPLLRHVKFDRTFTLADFPNEKPLVTVYGNLVDATQGKTETEAPIGNGDNRLVFQTFQLPKAPLTYLISGSATPPEVPELDIYVNDRLWKRVASFFGRGPEEQIYIVREDAENNSWVQFGDGVTGARLPSGIKNVVAKYRTGTGAFGELKPKTKVQAGKKLDDLDKIQMPEVAAGGSEPEDGANARDAAPGKIQSLDRLVSLQDFETETLAISGVTKAAATWELINNNPEVVITVLMDTGRDKEIDEVRSTLAGYNRGPWSKPVSYQRSKGPASLRRRSRYVWFRLNLSRRRSKDRDSEGARRQQWYSQRKRRPVGFVQPATETFWTKGICNVDRRKNSTSEGCDLGRGHTFQFAWHIEEPDDLCPYKANP